MILCFFFCDGGQVRIAGPTWVQITRQVVARPTFFLEEGPEFPAGLGAAEGRRDWILQRQKIEICIKNKKNKKNKKIN